MPSIYTHDYFAKDIYSKINNKIPYQIHDLTTYKIFAQSFDHLFCYNFLSIKKGHKYRSLGHYAHMHNVWEYFKNLVTYIKDNKLYDDENLGYLYGSLTHYALDSTCHPYIHYISGRLNRKDIKHTKKYMGYHAINEIMIDSLYYYKNHKTKYCKYKLYKDIIPIVYFSDNLKTTINYVFKETFNEDNIGNTYNKSYIQNHYVYKLLMYDRFGIKKFMYRIIDFLTPFKKFKAYSYSHHVKNNNEDVLNLKHQTWLHPVTGEKHNESFEDLYLEAEKKVIKYIKKCNDFFDDKCTLKELEKAIKNISYSTGLDADTRVKFLYFKN